jgi:chromosomal replication initiation ATPase DnaA
VVICGQSCFGGPILSQLAFPFPQTHSYGIDDFIEAPANAEALAWIGRVQDWPDGRLAVFGEPGSGKTHLLHVFAARNDAVLVRGETLGGLMEPPRQALAIDEAEAADPEALLHRLNAAAEARVPVLLAGRAPPARWDFALPDLVSRLRAITSVALQTPDDALLRALLARLLADRQLVVSEPVQEFLLARLPRTGVALREAAARLDHASLASGGRVTRAMAAEVLAMIG